MSLLDALIIVFLIVGILGGLRRGFIRSIVSLIGLVVILVLSYYLKNPVATFLYKHLPFFKFNGLIKGVSVINILLYELIAFLVVFCILYLILRIIIKITGIIESLLKATIILGFISKILGGLVGLIEAYIIIFILLFVTSQPFLRFRGWEESKIAPFILDHTPIMSSAVSNTRKAVSDVYILSEKYKSDSKEFNDKAIELFIKYEVITEENANYLREKGKI